jgi:branched-subunit amino acid aminotransferase/4-amino-4-deoxychorismate lyase
MRPRWVLLGNRLRRAEDATVPVWSAAVRWGAGVFETVGCAGGEPLLWPALPTATLVERLLVRSELRGPAALRLVVVPVGRRIVVAAWAECYRPPRRLRALGATAHAVVLPAGPLAGVKCCSYQPYRWALARARAAGADVALLLDADGYVREVDHANIFAARDGLVRTPQAGRRCLAGIMRGWCLETLERTGVQAMSGDLSVEELRRADEVWLTSSLAGIVPLRALDGERLAGAGELVRALQRTMPVPR